MIKPEEFYSQNEYPTSSAKKNLWKNIEMGIPKEKKAPFFNVDLRSFAFGIGTAFTLILVCVGVFTLYSGIAEKDEPAYVKINNAYSKAIDEVEKTIPNLTTAGYSSSYSLDEMINAGKSKLKNIDAGIEEIKSDAGPNDFSPVKQSRLRSLYKMKLDILSRMIDMEENHL
jgi:hypothetical protein